VRILLQLIERAPDAETKIPRLCSSLETRTWPKAGYSRAKAVIAAFAAIPDIELTPSSHQSEPQRRPLPRQPDMK